MSERPADGSIFLAGNGEMSGLIVRYDWTASALGPIGGWSESLKAAVNLLLAADTQIVLFCGPEFIAIYNDAYAPTIGDKHPRALGRPARENWAELWDDLGPLLSGVLKTGKTFSAKNRPFYIERSDVGETVYFDISYSAVRNTKGEVEAVLCIVNETTDQVRAEKGLRESEERFQLALSAGGGIGTWDWDVPSDRVYADARFAALYNVAPDLAKAGAPIAAFFGGIHPHDIGRVQAEVAKAIETGAPFVSEYRLAQPDGSVRWVVAHGRCTLGPDGRPLRFPGASFDITDRKRAEERLRELNSDLERQVVERSSERGTTWHVSPHLLSVIDLNNGKFVRVNPAWKETLGWSESEMVGESYGEFLHPDDIAPSQVAFEKVMSGVPVLDFENRYRAKDGTYHWLGWVAVPEDGRLYSTARDISDEKRRAEALAAAEDSLRQSQKMEAIGQLTGGIAHDFNNLLAGISGSLELLDRRLSQGRLEGVGRYINVAQESTRRAASLTQRLLAFARRQTLDPKVIDANRTISGMADLLMRSVGPDVHVEVVQAAGLWGTKLDPSQLENAVLNLCINARDAMAPDGGRITIETANKWLDDRAAKERDLPPGQYVSVSVSDTGTGMTAEVIDKIFDPFFTTKPLGQGTGLGLSMIYGFVRQSGGQVRVYSETGKGTTMTLYFPRFVGELSAEERPEDVSVDRGDGETVLVIDDEPAIRMVIGEVLTEIGYRVIEAADGPSGLKIVHAGGRIDLLITDVGLPNGLNGRQVADAARSINPKLKILFITGFAENAAIGNGHLDAGMSVITKPFSNAVLLNKVRQIIDG